MEPADRRQEGRDVGAEVPATSGIARYRAIGDVDAAAASGDYARVPSDKATPGSRRKVRAQLKIPDGEVPFVAPEYTDIIPDTGGEEATGTPPTCRGSGLASTGRSGSGSLALPLPLPTPCAACICIPEEDEDENEDCYSEVLNDDQIYITVASEWDGSAVSSYTYTPSPSLARSTYSEPDREPGPERDVEAARASAVVIPRTPRPQMQVVVIREPSRSQAMLGRLGGGGDAVTSPAAPPMELQSDKPVPLLSITCWPRRNRSTKPPPGGTSKLIAAFILFIVLIGVLAMHVSKMPPKSDSLTEY